jgi:hypothetical protein
VKTSTDWFRTLIFDGAVKVLAEGPDRTEVNAHFVATRFPAAFVSGVTVLKQNDRGRARAEAFAAFAASPPSTVTEPSKRRALPRQTPAEPMPERTPTAPVVEPVAPIVATPTETPVELVHAMDLPAEALRPVVGDKIERGSMVTLADDLCARCHRHVIAGVTPTTPKGTETWCAHCRRVESARRAGHTVGGGRKTSEPAKLAPKRAVNSPKIPESSKRPTSTRTAPSQSPKAPASTSLDEALAIVEANAALIARLGGTATATELADHVEAHCGPAAVIAALRRVLAVAEGRV